MTNPAAQPRIAIIVDETVIDANRWIAQALCSVGCRADILHANQLTAHAELEPYELVIYRYGHNFSSVAPILDLYDGPLIVYYCASTALSNLRPYPQAATLVRQRELARQQVCEWVQENNQRAFWLADSAPAAADLIAWGVSNTAQKLNIMPPHIKLEPGLYAEQTKPAISNTLNILLAGRFVPETGHIKILETLHHYQQLSACQIELHIAGHTEPQLEAYMQEVAQHARRLGLSPSIHSYSATSPLTNQLFLQADIMIQTATQKLFSAEAVQAQAMGLALFEIPRTEQAAEAAKRLSETALNPAALEQLVLAGYRNISQQHTALAIEQRLLGAVAHSLVPAGSR